MSADTENIVLYHPVDFVAGLTSRGMVGAVKARNGHE